MKNITLNNGVEIPIIGSGTNTFGKEGNAYSGDLRGDTQEVDWAIENGYRHFDTAQAYFNEEVLGKGIEKSAVPREEFFITTKLNTYDGYQGETWAHEAIETSLKKLKTDYIDLFLIHFPWEDTDEMVQAWEILEEYYGRDIFKAIGVSNFEKQQLDLILKKGNIKPAVNQIESHPNKWNDELIAYHRENEIATVAWSPLRGIEAKEQQVLEVIGNPYGKTYAQVALRYQIERGIIVIPKSHNKDHQAQSLDIFDFELSKEDRKKIAAL